MKLFSDYFPLNVGNYHDRRGVFANRFEAESAIRDESPPREKRAKLGFRSAAVRPDRPGKHRG